MKNKNVRKHKSSVLVVSLIIMSIVLVASLSVALVAVQERKSSIGESRTTKVFHSTEEIAEIFLQKLQKSPYRFIDQLRDYFSYSSSYSSGSYSVNFSCENFGYYKGRFENDSGYSEDYEVWLLKMESFDPETNEPQYIEIDCNSNESISEIKRIRVASTTSQVARSIEVDYTCQIKSCQSLVDMSNASVSTIFQGYVCLANDIDCSGVDNFKPISNFQGVLDGRGYVIQNLKINSGASQQAGLFQYSKNSTITNLGIENPDIDVSGAIGSGHGGPFASAILNSSEMTNCYAKGGKVTGSTSSYLGGLVGTVADNSVIKNSYSTTDIISGRFVGGLAGEARIGSQISKSYYGGALDPAATYKGGLIGYAFYGGPSPLSGEDSYYDLDKNPTVIKNCGFDRSPPYCPSTSLGKTTSEMTKEDTYEDWDFDDTWRIEEDETYPCLQGQGECPTL